MNVFHTIHACIHHTFIQMYNRGRFVLHMVEAVLDQIHYWEHFPPHLKQEILGNQQGVRESIYPKIASDSTSEEFTPTRLHTHLPPLQTLVKPLVYLLSFWLTSYRWVPNTPFLGSINFTEQLTEFREIHHLLAYLFIIEGYNPGIARCKRCVG